MKNKIMLVAFLFNLVGITAQKENSSIIISDTTIYSINDMESPAYFFIRKHHHFWGCEDIIDKVERWRCSFLKKQIFIMEQLKYPDEAFETKVAGVVIAKFIVEGDGSLSNFRIVHGIGNGCDEEVLKALDKLPRFEPGLASRRPVRDAHYVVVEFPKKEAMKKYSSEYIRKMWIKNYEQEQKELILFLEKNLIYPEEAFSNAIQGIVVVKIFADKKGRQKFEIEHGIDPACDMEALRLVKLMPQYEPDIWEKELNKETQYVPILFSVYAYELWKNRGNPKD